VLHRAHNWVLLCLLVPLPGWRGKYLHIPVGARLYKRAQDGSDSAPFRTRQQLVAEMVALVQNWVPHRKLQLATDGQYPSRELVESLPQGVPYISRLRSNAVLNALPPKRKPGQRGATHKKGARLPSLEQTAKHARFKRCYVWRYGRKQLVQVHSFVCLWYKVVQSKPVRVVIVRDPQRKQRDDYFVCTDITLSPVAIIEAYAARWGIEEMIRESKQTLGFEDVQSWSPQAVLKQAPLALILHAVTQISYLEANDSLKATTLAQPLPSFQRMLCALRIDKWQERIMATFHSKQNAQLFLRPLASALAATS
jgi:hypothetical protein